MVRSCFGSVNKRICLTLMFLEGKETRVTIQQVADDMDQVLNATHTVDDRVGRVEDKVLDVDSKVTRVDNNVKAIDDKVAVVIDGA